MAQTRESLELTRPFFVGPLAPAQCAMATLEEDGISECLDKCPRPWTDQTTTFFIEFAGKVAEESIHMRVLPQLALVVAAAA